MPVNWLPLPRMNAPCTLAVVVRLPVIDEIAPVYVGKNAATLVLP